MADGEIAIINLESARRRSWSRFFADPLRDGAAETVVGHEQLTGQFIGDLSALDRLELMVSHLIQADEGSTRTALIQAQVASFRASLRGCEMSFRRRRSLRRGAIGNLTPYDQY